MKKSFILSLLGVSLLSSLGSCSKNENVIKVCASESPHAEILNECVKPILKEKGYDLEVTVLDWTIQNEAVYNLDYDANYFQHRPYLEQFDSGSSIYNENYTYSKVFPVVGVHFEPLRIYEGKSKDHEFESIKTTATYEICADPSNAIRALDLLKSCGAIKGYEVDKNGNPLEDKLPKNITLIAEELLVAQKNDYDYAVLPCNTALTGNIKTNEHLPSETDEVADLRANVLAANANKYKSDETYKNKIDVLATSLLDSSVSDFIKERYNNIITPVLKDYR